MSNKTEYTQADFIVGFDKLSKSQKTYRLSQKVYIDPKYEPVRVANRNAGISYTVNIAGYEYKFDCAEDTWGFAPVADRAYCGYDYFISELNAGRVWESGDVEVWIANKDRQAYCIEFNGLQWHYATSLEAWNNSALQVRKGSGLQLDDNIITGIRNYEDFARYLDEGAVLGFHSLKVYKIHESEV
jgi:hypothetical protein